MVEDTMTQVRSERRASFLQFENKLMKIAIGVVIAALSGVFLAGGNWYLSQHKIKELRIITDVLAVEKVSEEKHTEVHKAVDIKFEVYEQVNYDSIKRQEVVDKRLDRVMTQQTAQFNAIMDKLK